MPDIIEDIDDVIAGWERGPDVYKWSPSTSEQQSSFGPTPTLEELGFCIHASEDGSTVTITDHHLCAICNAS